METGIVLLRIDRAQMDSIGDRLSRLPGVELLYAVQGPYDLIAIVRAAEREGIDRLVSVHMAKVAGVASAEGMRAEHVYTRRDTDGYFSGGLGP